MGFEDISKNNNCRQDFNSSGISLISFRLMFNSTKLCNAPTSDGNLWMSLSLRPNLLSFWSRNRAFGRSFKWFMSSNNSSKLREYRSKSFTGMVCRLHCLNELNVKKQLTNKKFTFCQWSQLADYKQMEYKRNASWLYLCEGCKISGWVTSIHEREKACWKWKKLWSKLVCSVKKFARSLIDPRAADPKYFPSGSSHCPFQSLQVATNSKNQKNMRLQEARGGQVDSEFWTYDQPQQFKTWRSAQEKRLMNKWARRPVGAKSGQASKQRPNKRKKTDNKEFGIRLGREPQVPGAKSLSMKAKKARSDA